jgi:hypothetical protein
MIRLFIKEYTKANLLINPKTRLKAFVDDLIYKIKDFIYTKHKTS